MSNKIIGKQIVEDYFGYFPTFHDSEVIEFYLNRTKITAKILIYTFDTDNEINGSRNYRKKNECFISLEIENINDISLKGFNHQNVLDRIRFIDTDDNKIKIIFDECFGLSGYIIAEQISIVSLMSTPE